MASVGEVCGIWKFGPSKHFPYLGVECLDIMLSNLTYITFFIVILPFFPLFYVKRLQPHVKISCNSVKNKKKRLKNVVRKKKCKEGHHGGSVR